MCKLAHYGNCDPETKDKEYCIFHKPNKNEEEAREFYRKFLEKFKPDKKVFEDGYERFIFKCPVDCSGFVFPKIPNDMDFNFENAIFEKDAIFRDAVFEDDSYISFYHTFFKGEADFSYATFKYTVDFSGAQFENKANFSKANLSKGAMFIRTKFNDEANFSGAILMAPDFWRATFRKEAIFCSAIFKNGANFQSAVFKWRSNFAKAIFDGYVDFRGVTFGDNTSFSHAIFNDCVDFSYSIFGNWTVFYGTIFMNNVKFSFISISKSLLDFGRKEPAKFHGKLSFYGATLGSKIYIDLPPESFKDPEAEAEACRVQRIAYEKEDRRTDADRMFVRERRALRRIRIKNARGTRKILVQASVILEWFLADLICEYGTNWRRPVYLWLFTVLFMFPMFYFISSICGCPMIYGLVNDNVYDCLLNSIYFSVVTATTLGYGDYHPIGWGKLLAGIEAVFGTFMWAVFLAVFARKYMR